MIHTHIPTRFMYHLFFPAYSECCLWDFCTATRPMPNQPRSKRPFMSRFSAEFTDPTTRLAPSSPPDDGTTQGFAAVQTGASLFLSRTDWPNWPICQWRCSWNLMDVHFRDFFSIGFIFIIFNLEWQVACCCKWLSHGVLFRKVHAPHAHMKAGIHGSQDSASEASATLVWKLGFQRHDHPNMENKWVWVKIRYSPIIGWWRPKINKHVTCNMCRNYCRS